MPSCKGEGIVGLESLPELLSDDDDNRGEDDGDIDDEEAEEVDDPVQKMSGITSANDRPSWLRFIGCTTNPDGRSTTSLGTFTRPRPRPRREILRLLTARGLPSAAARRGLFCADVKLFSVSFRYGWGGPLR